MKLLKEKVTMSRREVVMGLATGSVVILAPGCTYNEELGRSQLLFADSNQMAQLAAGAWTDLKGQERISRNPKYTSRVNRVAPKVIAAANGNPAQWEVEVFDSDQLNAFALPGGKVGFYTGLLDVMDNDSQIATVMGHEAAHINLRHSAERYSQSTLAQSGLSVAQVAVSGSQYSNQIMGVLGMGASLGVILPYSRRHEFEADRFGVRYMHRAGYDANEAVRFWETLSSSKTGAPPALLSTHPSDASRIAALKREIALLR